MGIWICFSLRSRDGLSSPTPSSNPRSSRCYRDPWTMSFISISFTCLWLWNTQSIPSSLDGQLGECCRSW